LSWGRINHPEEIVKLDEKIQVVILEFDDDKKRIALGLKQLTSHPWENLSAELKVGDKVKGKVVVIADYGAFVEIAAGVEGLIHVSEMSWSQHLRTAADFVTVGAEVEAQVLTLDREERKMSLGMKQLTPDPWALIMDKYAKGSRHTGTIRNFTNFGVFVEMEEGVDGLVHISDLSWSKKIKHPSEFCKIGDKMDVTVLEIDGENRRLSLGHKQLEDNPWDVFETVFVIGSSHQGTVTNVNDKGATISLTYGVEGFCPNRFLGKEDKTNAKVEDTLEFVVTEFSKDAKRIVVSHRSTWDAEKEAQIKAEKDAKKNEKDETKKTVKKMKDSAEKTTLGDIESLAALKEKLDNK
ncbi:MAG: S1 RNA-binding domain-containing protein, partial [Bacteroidia bacterium]|nr:S1 RNA-binding domain-containing protein [Bacteroidia bacterium]